MFTFLFAKLEAEKSAENKDADLTVSKSELISPEIHNSNKMKVVVGKRNIAEMTPNDNLDSSPVLNGEKVSPWKTGSQERMKKNLPKKTKHVL